MEEEPKDDPLPPFSPPTLPVATVSRWAVVYRLRSQINPNLAMGVPSFVSVAASTEHEAVQVLRAYLSDHPHEILRVTVVGEITIPVLKR